VSASGTLVYAPSPPSGAEAPILWMNAQGETSPLRSAPSNWTNPRFAPDGRSLAVDIVNGGQADIWTYDWTRDALTRLTSDPADDVLPVWTPDGRRIAFASTRGNKATLNIYWQRADGSGEAQRLTEGPNAQLPGTWDPSGRFLVFQENTPDSGLDLMILPMEGDEASGWKPGVPQVFLRTPFLESAPVFSPDGRWIAYHSNEAGAFDVYVRPFPGPGGKWRISTAGGSSPVWSPTGPELFYRSPANQIMVAPYTVEGNAFRAGRPRLWSEQPIRLRPRQRPYDLHPDGERWAVDIEPKSESGDKRDRVVFIFNFFQALRATVLRPVASR